MDEAGRPSTRAIVLATGCLLLMASAAFYSFRLPFPSGDLGWNANLPRTVGAVAIGTLLGAAAALRGFTVRPILFEAGLFAISTGAAAGMSLGILYFGSMVAGLPLAVVAAGIALLLAQAARLDTVAGTFALAAVLLALFGVGIAAYLAASTDPSGPGAIGLWLLGDVAHISTGRGVFLIVLAGLGAALAVNRKDLRVPITIGMYGLAFGAAGPVAFVGHGAAALASRLGHPKGEPSHVSLSAIVGATLVVSGDALLRGLIGGYGPPLNLSLAMIAIPALLWWKRRQRATDASPSALALGVEIIFLPALTTGALFFLYALTRYVRLAT